MADEKIEVVAPDGDVVLVVGAPTGPATCRKMRVYASTLAAISPVFKTLFGPHFREGQQVRDSLNPAEIPLPDDTFPTVLRLCRMAHMSYDDLNTRLSAEELLDLAVTVDKYCCVAPVKLQCSALLLAWCQYDPIGPSTTAASLEHDLWRMTSAAYLIECPHTFRTVTSMLMTHTWDKFDFLSTESLPSSVTATVAEKRSTARGTFSVALGRMTSNRTGHCFDNKDAEQDYRKKIFEIFNLRYWPPKFDSQSTSLKALIEKTRQAPALRHSEIVPCKEQCYSTIEARAFRNAADLVAKECTGLCLACAKVRSSVSEAVCDEHRAA
ncbi:hypothetical protein CKM354_000900300 [Cercospora kikuchii]|uniref:BTB domain-containing protein n=1 Tax=Cercospora kikuchii TaxID=84275 RepID=A0A9P3CWV5_9PEZI|nr:uncharacterized protein CKM354_000900300 [Cercospora kikuchii]GIZ45853.1 hypothetical protein CKM354_000900300 [Cercospora kikuchii]